MRRLLPTLTIAAAAVALAQPAEAQLNYGVQGAVMTGWEASSGLPAGAADLNGTFGLGARAGFDAPLLPIGVVGQMVYYFPEGDGTYITYSAAGKLRIPLPVFSPYAIGGWQFRRTSGGGSSNTESGFMGGVGLQLNFGVSLFLEGTVELGNEVPSGVTDFDNTPIVIKGGILLGG